MPRYTQRNRSRGYGPALPNGRMQAKNKVIKRKVVNKVKKMLGAKKIQIRGTGKYGSRISGRGAYSIAEIGEKIATPFIDDTKSKGVVNRIARFAGKSVGSIVGLGDEVGNAASYLSRAFGFGDYTIKKNSFQDYGNIAQFANHGTIVFSHREYIMDINSSIGFVNQAFPINPGNSTLFPWLSTLAKNFEQYEFLGLIFEFKSTSASAVGSVNTGLGTVVMATDYDVLDSPYPDKRAMEVSEFSTSAAPFQSQIHPIECDPKQNVMKQMFIQSGNNAANYSDDPRFSALGNFQIATSGMQAVSTIGELWVSYHVKLLKPQIEAVSDSAITRLHIGMQTAPGGAPTLNFTQTNNIGALTAQISGAYVQITAATQSGVGTYLISQCMRSTSATTGGLTTANPIPLFTGTAGWGIASYTIGGVANAEPSSFQNFSANSGGAGAQYNPTSKTWIVRLATLGDTVKLPMAYDPSFTVYTDIYVAPYALTFLNSSPLRSGKDEIQSLRDQMAHFLEDHSKLKNELKEIKEEIEDQEDNSYETTVSSSDVSVLIDKLASVNLIKNSASEIDECLKNTVEMLGRNLCLSDRIRLEHYYTNLKKFHI